MVVGQLQVGIPTQSWRPAARSNGGGNHGVKNLVWNDEQLTAGEGYPEDCNTSEAESRERAWRYRELKSPTPGQGGTQCQYDDPARQSSGQAWEQMQDKIDNQTPQRQPNHQPLCERQKTVGLPERDPGNDVANCRQRQ